MTPLQTRILERLRDVGPAGTANLARIFACDWRGMHIRLRRLAKRGLVERLPCSRPVWRVTPVGCAALLAPRPAPKGPKLPTVTGRQDEVLETLRTTGPLDAALLATLLGGRPAEMRRRLAGMADKGLVEHGDRKGAQPRHGNSTTEAYYGDWRLTAKGRAMVGAGADLPDLHEQLRQVEVDRQWAEEFDAARDPLLARLVAVEQAEFGEGATA